MSILGPVSASKLSTAKPGERKLGLGSRLYFPAIAKGMAYTFRHLFRKQVTIKYPEKPIELGSEFRGRPVLVAEGGQERCVACGLCARACPPLAISMQASETADPKERYPMVFEIDMLRCIYCGLCEEVCPEEAIVMSSEYDYTFARRDDAVMGKDRLLVEKEALKDRLDFLRQRRNANYGEVWDHDPHNNTHSVRNRPH